MMKCVDKNSEEVRRARREKSERDRGEGATEDTGAPDEEREETEDSSEANKGLFGLSKGQTAIGFGFVLLLLLLFSAKSTRRASENP